LPYGNKEFFSEDVIQRIASGNEPTQTLISLDMLENVLKPHQMRNVLGGSGCGGSCDCWYCECSWHDGAWYQCSGSPVPTWACEGGIFGIQCYQA